MRYGIIFLSLRKYGGDELKKFYLSEHAAVINFDALYCESEAQIVSSRSFRLVLERFVVSLKKKNDRLIQEFNKVKSSDVLDAYKLLLVWNYYDVYQNNPYLRELLNQRGAFYRFTEKFYDYWRKIEKYGMIARQRSHYEGMRSSLLISTADDFNKMVLSFYRLIAEKILGTQFNVYRQLPAGVNASLFLVNNKWSNVKTYEKLQHANFISGLLVRPPFMIHSKANTRVGTFREIDRNPLDFMKFDKNDFIVYPVKVGPCLAYVYFHIDYLHHGVALSNLFEVASDHEFKDQKPDLLYVYGVKESEFDGVFYHDEIEDIYIGTVAKSDKNDYFGYMKKMLLTLHNVYMIDRDHLPIHGAMVNVLLNDGRQKNIVVIGDSGAGKSETLEALRIIGGDYVKEIHTIYDDMGTFVIRNQEMISFGTEIGAFIRLDDLDSGYAYQEIDRAVFLNPDQINARIILPVSSYHFIMENHKVDLVLYANNYEDTEDGMKLFDDVNYAIDVFGSGKRLAKGTTDEIGLVKSFFANPFGPVQKREKCDELLRKHFTHLYEVGIPVGEIYTRLAIRGYEMKGPQIAARKLLEFLNT